MKPTVIKTRLSYHKSHAMLEELSLQDNILFHASGKSTFLLNEDRSERISFILPPLFPEPEEGVSLPDYIKTIAQTPPSYIVLLIQAGAAALGYFNKGEIEKHKALTRYMVRKKRGKSQLTYLRQKGKSRAGSRIRLRESLEFFEEINSRLKIWDKSIQTASRIYYSCPVRLLNELYLSKVKPPFDRQDKKLEKILFHVNPPNYKELTRINYLLNSGCLVSETTET